MKHAGAPSRPFGSSGSTERRSASTAMTISSRFTRFRLVGAPDERLPLDGTLILPSMCRRGGNDERQGSAYPGRGEDPRGGGERRVREPTRKRQTAAEGSAGRPAL